MTTDWSKPTRYIVGVGLALLACYILYLSRSVFPLLIIATLIAVIVRPAILWLHYRARLPRSVAVALVYLAVAILVPLVLMLAIPAIVDAIRYVLSIDYQSILTSWTEWLRSSLISIRNMPLPEGGLNVYIDQTVDAVLAELGRGSGFESAPNPPSVGTIIQSLGSALTTTFRTAAGVVGSVFSRITLILFIFLASIYISLSAHTFPAAFIRAVPDRFRPEITMLMARIGRLWNAFFRGQLTLMLLIGLISFIGLTLLGMPGAIYLAIVAGLLEIIPNLGPIIATIPAVIVALLQGSTYLPVSPLVFALIVIAFYILVQQLENNLIVPRVLGDAVDLPALIVMTGVLVGAEVGGLLGALLATPVIATIREIVRYAYKKILGENPYPNEKEELMASAAHSPLGLRELIQRYIHFPTPRATKTLPKATRSRNRKPGAKVFTPKK